MDYHSGEKDTPNIWPATNDQFTCMYVAAHVCDCMELLCICWKCVRSECRCMRMFHSSEQNNWPKCTSNKTRMWLSVINKLISIQITLFVTDDSFMFGHCLKLKWIDSSFFSRRFLHFSSFEFPFHSTHVACLSIIICLVVPLLI